MVDSLAVPKIWMLCLMKYKTSNGYKYVTYDHPKLFGRNTAFKYNIRATNLLDFFWQQLRNKYEENEDRLISSVTLNWSILDHLKFRGRIGTTTLALQLKTNSSTTNVSLHLIQQAQVREDIQLQRVFIKLSLWRRFVNMGR